MEILQNVILFISTNIAYILVIIAVIYFAFFIYSIIRRKQTGEGFSFRLKYFLPFLIILGIGIYCLVTGRNLNEFIG